MDAETKESTRKTEKNWMKAIRKAMNERNLNESQWEDRKQGSIVVGQRRKTF
jgi:tRNA pseudouridine-54 N-methylase